jgi:hypothetical protein
MAKAKAGEKAVTAAGCGHRRRSRRNMRDWPREHVHYRHPRRTSPSHSADVVPECIPTRVGDVLMLRTEESFTIHAVGLVSTDGQQHFCGQLNVKHFRDRDSAMVEARTLLAPGRRIFLCDIDTNDWSEISNRDSACEPHHRDDAASRRLARSA